MGVWQWFKLKCDDYNGGSSANGAIGEFSAIGACNISVSKKQVSCMLLPFTDAVFQKLEILLTILRNLTEHECNQY